MTTIRNPVGEYSPGFQAHPPGKSEAFAKAVTDLREAVDRLEAQKVDVERKRKDLSHAEMSLSEDQRRYEKTRKALDALLPPVEPTSRGVEVPG